MDSPKSCDNSSEIQIGSFTLTDKPEDKISHKADRSRKAAGGSPNTRAGRQVQQTERGRAAMESSQTKVSQEATMGVIIYSYDQSA